MKDQNNIQGESRNPKNSKSKEWQSVISSAFGAAMGVVAGNMVERAMASEQEDPKVEQHDIIIDDPTVVPENDINTPTINPEPTILPEEPSTVEPDIQVLSVEQIQLEGYGPANVAGILVNGQQGMVIDLNNDNIADALAVDLNEDGTINDNEIIDISYENIAMSDLAAAISPMSDPNSDILLANQTDYENQGDVQEYFA